MSARKYASPLFVWLTLKCNKEFAALCSSRGPMLWDECDGIIKHKLIWLFWVRKTTAYFSHAPPFLILAGFPCPVHCVSGMRSREDLYRRSVFTGKSNHSPTEFQSIFNLIRSQVNQTVRQRLTPVYQVLYRKPASHLTSNCFVTILYESTVSPTHSLWSSLLIFWCNWYPVLQFTHDIYASV